MSIAARGWLRRIAGIICTGLLVGCSTLPEVERLGRHGEFSRVADNPQVSDELLLQVRDEGRSDAFDRHAYILAGQGEELIAGNDIELLIDGPPAFEAMLSAVEEAEQRIFVQTYIFEDDGVGQRLAEALLKKRAEGVAVNVIYDSVGSLFTPAAFFNALEAGGVAVCEFNPVSPWRRVTGILSLNHRDHRKLLLVDNAAAFTGGINVSAVYSSGSVTFAGSHPDQEDAGWRDTHIRVRGPAVAEFERLFKETWARQSCGDEPPAGIEQVSEPAGERLIAVIGTDAEKDSSRFYRALLAAINGATDSIHITMAYFVPDPQTVDALAAAARRGVEVELVLPGHSDSRLALHAGRSHYDRLLRAGVSIFEFHESLLHVKTVAIDGVWSTVGSSNLDWRSFLHNDELNTIIVGREFGEVMERQFLDDRSRAEEVTLEQWRKRSPWRRVQEGFSRLLEYWL